MVTLYSIHSDDTPVLLPEHLGGNYYEDEQITPTEAKLTLEDNKSGSLEISLLPENLAYDKIELIRSTLKVTEYAYNDDGTLASETILWKGRAISIDEDINRVRSIICEGALAFLNDIVCYPISTTIASDVIVPDVKKGIVTEIDMKNEAFRSGLQEYLDTGGNTDSTISRKEGSLFKQSSVSTETFPDCIYTVGRGYNSSCAEGRKFKVGIVTIANVEGVVGFADATQPENEWYPSNDYPKGAWYLQAELSSPTAAFAGALDQILDITVNLNGGHLRVRHEREKSEEVMYLDYIGNCANSNATAKYGENIIEFNGRLELNAPVTDIIPRGAVISTWNNNEVADSTVDTDRWRIGQTVVFKGTRHYVASTSDIGYKCTPGYAQITNINLDGKHPIHLIHIPSATGEESTVYGWVDQSDIEIGYGIKGDGSEFIRRSYKSYPYTEYIGIIGGYEDGTHVVNEALMKKYGRIQQIVDFPDIEDPDELKAAAQEWLRMHSSFLKQTYEVSLVDLGHIYGTGQKPIHLLDRIHVSLPNHGIDEYMPVTKISIDLLNPVDTVVSFSKESTASNARIRTMSATLGTQTVDLIQPSNSLSQSIAHNNRYMSQTDEHAKINTSLSLNSRNTLPNGKTRDVEVLTADGGTFTLNFVNGLYSGGDSEYNYFNLISGSSVLRPANDDMWLNVVGSLFATVGSKHALVREALFGDRSFVDSVYTTSNGKQLEVYNYPHYGTDPETTADELILDTTYGSDYYGMYYRLIDGVKKYFAMPCIYFLPSGCGLGSIYIFYVGPIDMHGKIMFTQKVSNLGRITRTTDARTAFKTMFNDVFVSAMKNNLKRQAQKSSSPTHTSVADMYDINGNDYYNVPGTALLIAPYTAIQPQGGIPILEHGLYVSPAIVEESSDRAWINGAYRPNKIKIYTGGLPLKYYYDSADVMPDMFLESNSYDRSEVKTEVTKAKYYVFSSKEDMDALVNDYLTGNGTQSDIERRHRPNIVALGNSSAYPDEKNYRMQLIYRFNGITKRYFVDAGENPLTD